MWVDGSVLQMLPLSYLVDSESPWWVISLFAADTMHVLGALSVTRLRRGARASLFPPSVFTVSKGELKIIMHL